jgi:acetolactate synthase-1/2/3 large subunit
VKHVFGYPGGAVLYIYDAIFKQDKFQHVLVRHEQAAVHAADAYSRSSNTVGVALVTSGPGVTNAVTGLSTAYMDSIPMVVISGQVPSHAIGQDAFQECDTVGITRPVVKHNFLVKDVKDLARRSRKPSSSPVPAVPARCWSISRRTSACTSALRVSARDRDALVQAGRQGPSGQIRKAVQLLLQAERPMIYTGGGVILANASPELNRWSTSSASRSPTR